VRFPGPTMEPSAMYGPSQPLNIPSRIGAGERDDGSGNEPAVDGHHHHIQYETHALDDGAAGGAVVVEDVTSDAVYVSGGGGPEESSQLTLSFRGQVYVFDAVTPDKVPFPPFQIYYYSIFSYFSLFRRCNWMNTLKITWIIFFESVY